MSGNNIEEYISEEEVDIEIPNESLRSTQRRNKRNREWSKENTYQSKDEVINFINLEKTWSCSFTNKTYNGKKVYYRCNKVKKCSEQCPAGIYIHIINSSEDIDLFRTAEGHNHNNLDAINRLSSELKEEIEMLFHLNVKPKRILEKLKEKGLVPKNKSQVSNYLNKLKEKIYGPNKISLGELEEWCINHSEIPDSDDKAFVISYVINYSDKDEYNGDDDGDVSQFRVFISTKRLLKVALHSKIVHADATYKLVWEGMPVLIIGTSDMDRHFHTFGIGVCSNEKKDDFAFIFQSLVDGLKKFGEVIQVNILISDASSAIRNAFTEVFGADKVLIMCWAHMRRKVVQNLNLIDGEFKEEVMDDIDSLQLSSNKEIFEKSICLFQKKWIQKKQNDFVGYMKQMWLTTHKNWYEGVARNTPSTNNALESFNNVIKNEDTLRERLPLSRFLQLCLNSTERWSRNSVDKVFSDFPTIELQQWTDAYCWAKSNLIVSQSIGKNTIEYYCSPKNKTKVTDEAISKLKEMCWKTFEQFKKRAFAVWIVELPKESHKWQEGSCTCPFFLKKFICKHILGIAIRLKYVKPPPAAKQIPIGEKRKRGRPKKATRALIVE